MWWISPSQLLIVRSRWISWLRVRVVITHRPPLRRGRKSSLRLEGFCSVFQNSWPHSSFGLAISPICSFDPSWDVIHWLGWSERFVLSPTIVADVDKKVSQPSSGKSTTLNSLTDASSKVGMFLKEQNIQS